MSYSVFNEAEESRQRWKPSRSANKENRDSDFDKANHQVEVDFSFACYFVPLVKRTASKTLHTTKRMVDLEKNSPTP